MITTQSCKICQSQEIEKYLKLKDHFLSQEDFKIDICLNCGFKFTNPHPQEKELTNYYKSEDYVSHSDKNEGLFFKLYNIVKNRSLKNKYCLVSKIVGKTGKVLDYGCGSGDLLKVFKKKNWHIEGIENDNETRNYASAKLNHKLLAPTEISNLKAQTFDVIMLWHVLEHIVDLNEIFQQLLKLIKPNSFIIIAVPNSDSYDARYYGKYWAAYDVPRHLYHFNHHTFQKFVNNHGCKIIKQKGMVFDAFYVSMLSEKYKKSMVPIFKGGLMGTISNLKARFFTKNFSSTIYVLERN